MLFYVSETRYLKLFTHIGTLVLRPVLFFVKVVVIYRGTQGRSVEWWWWVSVSDKIRIMVSHPNGQDFEVHLP